MLGSLLLPMLILPSALTQQNKTVDQKLNKLLGWLEVWRDRIVAHQEEQEASLDQVDAATGGVGAQLEKLLVDITELDNVTGSKNVLLQGRH